MKWALLPMILGFVARLLLLDGIVGLFDAKEPYTKDFSNNI